MAKKMKTVARVLVWVLTMAFITSVGWTWVQIQREKAAARAALEKRNIVLIQLCAERGLEAVDLEYPHTPKCLNLETGLMTVPRDFYKARGGRL